MAPLRLAIALSILLESTAAFTSPHGSRLTTAFVTATRLRAESDNLYNDFDNDDIEDEDDYIDSTELGDWRKFRMNLAETGTASDKKTSSEAPRKSVSKENEEVLRSQSKTLAEEYESGIWAHEAPKVCIFYLVSYAYFLTTQCSLAHTPVLARSRGPRRTPAS
jgi:hypothetical protein